MKFNIGDTVYIIDEFISKEFCKDVIVSSGFNKHGNIIYHTSNFTIIGFVETHLLTRRMVLIEKIEKIWR